MARTEVDEGSIGYPSHRSGSAQVACVKARGDKPVGRGEVEVSGDRAHQSRRDGHG